MFSLLKRFLIGIIILFILLSAALFLTGNSYIFNAFKLTYLKGHSTANIDDYVDFDNRTIEAGTHQSWEKHPSYPIKLSDNLQSTLDTDGTVAFAIIKDGKLMYENYWQGYTADSHTNSFSMAKSVITMLYLKAVEDGYIGSVNEPITTFLPEYKDNKYAQKCTLADLSAMTSGYDWTEDYYLPLNPTAKAYYGKNLEQQIVSRDFVEDCGDVFEYSSGDTQLLAIALTRALKPHGLNISSYLQKSFWQPLGMKNDAYWSLDGSAEIEKAYCCLNANALDFAKFGQLLLNQGNWQGEQLLSKDHVSFMVTPNASGIKEGETVTYGHSIWTYMDSPVPFYALQGHLGQRVLVLPEDNTVIVRLGTHKGEIPMVEGYIHEPDLGYYVSEVKKMFDTN